MTDAVQSLLDSEFNMVVALLAERCGLHFHAGNRDILDAGLLRVAEAERVSLSALARLLAYPSDTLLQRLIQAVTIGETYFFRHPEHFAVLGRHVIPQLLGQGKKRLRGWSAACATGEEAYSLAMTLSTYAAGHEVQILGTDINQAALKVAARGRYGAYSLRTTSLLADAFLTPLPSGEFEVAEAMRRLVAFRPLNLCEPQFPAQLGTGEPFDIILCRNVLVYLAPSLITQVLGRLRDCLSEGGYLVVSALDYSEQVPGLEPVTIDGVPLLRRTTPGSRVTPAVQSRLTPSTAAMREGSLTPGTGVPVMRRPTAESVENSLRNALRAAKSAADKGQLDRAEASARDALSQKRIPEALHLLALIRSERGHREEMEALLLEAVEIQPSYVLGHLSLGLLERPPAERFRSEGHLRTVIDLLRNRRDEEILQGPEPLQIAMARRLAIAGLENLEKRS